MQDFWLLNGFFIVLGLVYLIVSLVFIFRSRSRNSRNRDRSAALPNRTSKKVIGYNLLVTGLLISCTAGLLLIFGQLINLNLLVAAAINLTITLIAQRLHLFQNSVNDPDVSMQLSNNPSQTIIETIPDPYNPTEPSQVESSSPISSDGNNVMTSENSASGTDNSAIATSPRRPSVEISPEIYAELVEISSDPSAAVEEAIRWWLRRRLVDVSTESNRPSLRSSESWRSQQNKWND